MQCHCTAAFYDAITGPTEFFSRIMHTHINTLRIILEKKEKKEIGNQQESVIEFLGRMILL